MTALHPDASEGREYLRCLYCCHFTCPLSRCFLEAVPLRSSSVSEVSPDPVEVLDALAGRGGSEEVWEWLTSLAVRATALCRIPEHLREDYQQEALIAAVEAAPRWRADSGLSLPSYLLNYMKWGVRRAVRRQDPAPESVRKHLRAVNDVTDRLLSEGRSADDDTVANLTGLTVQRVRALRTWHGDAAVAAAAQVAGTHEAVAFESQMRQVESLFHHLSPRERHVVVRRYLEDAPVHVVAREMSISNGRVSQLAKRAVRTLRRLIQG